MRSTLILILVSLSLGSAASAWTASPSSAGVTSKAQSLDEVTVIGKADLPTLRHEIHQFVQSHAEPSTLIGQIGRWRQKVCPTVAGLRVAAANYVRDRIESVAREAGAPAVKSGEKCSANIDVVFTDEPQELLDHIAATKDRPLLGYYRRDLKAVATLHHPVQAWYMTGTRSLDAGLPIVGLAPGSAGANNNDDITAILRTGLHVDSAGTDGSMGFGASGNPESRLTKGLRSEFIHVLIIVDSKQVAKYSLGSISDYVALLALTRIGSQDTCDGLSSILTLFNAGCGEPPTAITSADRAYLTALYRADLDMNLALEQSDIHERMLHTISGK
ncbi:MAG TPA: hypothetical protein VMF03_05765 [Steroidobacteraceae bacterium]|nr:hypothetical protein [Steroidobacteraceae bacterium]